MSRTKPLKLTAGEREELEHLTRQRSAKAGHVRRARAILALEDILIGATALSRGMTLATRNTVHFKRLGVSMVNPFA